MKIYLLLFILGSSPLASANCQKAMQSQIAGLTQALQVPQAFDRAHKLEFKENVKFRIVVHRYNFVLTGTAEINENGFSITRKIEPEGGLAGARNLMLNSYRGGVEGVKKILKTESDDEVNEYLDRQIHSALDIMNSYLNAIDPGQDFMKGEATRKTKKTVVLETGFRAELPADPELRFLFASTELDYLAKLNEAAKEFPKIFR